VATIHPCPSARLASRRRRTCRPALEVLENRPLLAQILFGGDVLKETFDDLPSTAGTSSLTLDDPGFLNGVAVPSPAAVFHHTFDGIAAINAGGDTTPTNQPPGQTAQDLRLILGPGGGVTVGGNLIDTISIHPYLPSGASDAQVDQVSVDVRSSQTVKLAVQGENGEDTLQTTPTGNGWSTLAASANDVIGKDAAGNDVKLGEISLVFVSIPLTSATDFLEVDNVRAVVFFPGISTPPVAKDDVFELPQGAIPGQSFASTAIAVSDAHGNVLDNDSSAAGGALTARPIRLPAHGELSWSSDDSGTFTYITDSTFQGTDSFTYVANDGASDSNTATVTIVTKGSPLDTDGDGVPDDVEALAPPNLNGVYGDGNNDGTPDYLESKVASLPAAAGSVVNQYWTLTTSDGAFQSVSSVPIPLAPPLPANVRLASGLFGFQVGGVPTGGSVVVTMTPTSTIGTDESNGFYLLDPVSKTWSDFTGVTPTGGPGAEVSGTEVTLHLVDGQTGDQDGSANGVITLLGGPAVIVGLMAEDGSATFVHQTGDFSKPPPLTGQVAFVSPPGNPVTVSKVPGSEIGGTVDLMPNGSFVWHGSYPDGDFQFVVRAADGESSTATETIKIQDIPPLFGLPAPESFTLAYPVLFDSSGFLIGQDSTLFDDIGIHVLHQDKSPLDVTNSNIKDLNLSLIVVKQPIRATMFQLTPDGFLQYVPIADFKGTDLFQFKFNDGYLDSDIVTIYIRVDSDHTVFPPTPFHEAEIQLPVKNLVRSPTPLGFGLSDVSDPVQTNVSDFQPVANPSPTGDFPPGTSVNDFPFGFYQFTVTGDTSPGGIVLKLDLPAPVPAPTKYYKFGPTPNNPTPHWYDFAYDADPSSPDYGTGAVIVSQGEGNDVLIYLHFRYGRRGDDPSAPSFTVVDPGGPGFFAPAASVSGPASGDAGQPVTFTVSATDLSPAVLAAGFTYTIDWGDGSPPQTIAAAAGNGAGLTEAHVFSQPGSFTVQVTATDDTGLVSPATTTSIVIAEPPVVQNSVNPAKPTPPQVTQIVVAGQSRQGLTSFAIIFNESLTGGSATNASLYHVFEGVKRAVKKHKVTVFTRSVAIRNLTQSASGNTVTISLIKPFKGAVEVVVQGTITATNGASSSVDSLKTL
jgi:hypothetical protein